MRVPVYKFNLLIMKKIIAFGLMFTPVLVFAQGFRDVPTLFAWLKIAFTYAATLILSAAIVFFLWGVFQYVRAAGNEDAQKVGRSHIINGIIGIAVMVSVWGLVNFFTSSAGLQGGVQQAPTLPKVQG